MATGLEHLLGFGNFAFEQGGLHDMKRGLPEEDGEEFPGEQSGDGIPEYENEEILEFLEVGSNLGDFDDRNRGGDVVLRREGSVREPSDFESAQPTARRRTPRIQRVATLSVGNITSDRREERTRHRAPRRFRCPHAGCDRTFSKKYNMDSHFRVHSGEKPFSCEFEGCDRVFRWRSSLSSHRRSHLRDSSRRVHRSQ